MDLKPARLTFDELFDLVALFFACRGTCNRLRTSTVIRDKENIFIAAGYNGSLPKSPHCDEVGHLIVDNHCMRTNHGEDNAILNCLDLTRINGGTATIISNPCYPCARKLIAKKIKRLRYVGAYYKNAAGGDLVAELCKEKGVILEVVDINEVLMTLQKALEFLQGPGGPLKDFPEIQLVLLNRKVSGDKKQQKIKEDE
ncbi:MAG: hypothetical protein AAB772_02955 [Patescibacteria group bacterium]